MLRRLSLAGALASILTTSALAQLPMPLIPLHSGPRQLTPEERAKQQAIDQAYRAATKKIPDKKAATNDPWGTIRPTPPTATSRR